MKEEMAET